ncbi:hypothetical protein [Streptacidiphilus sp. MAP12-16]|uniref:hypothetical protein n=1 Tax=Streptacidiphilus sp. MAP12-16 TaxID=3156300 RepID=UPI003517B210
MAQLAARPDESPDGPVPALPAHTRTRPYHWIGTAAVLAAVVGTVLAVTPAGATVTTANGPHAVPAAAAPDPALAHLPLDCAGLPVKISQSFSADLTGNGTVATIAAAHCDSPNGTPPDGLFVIEKGQDGRPRVALVLIRDAEALTVRSVAVRSDGSISARVDGYSSPDVPRCCADLHETYTWTPHGSGYVRTISVPLSQA